MDFEAKNKPKNLGCMQRGPGPQYLLKTLTGFEDHDPSKLRSPAYTMKFRRKDRLGCTGPGPYPIAHHLTNRGYELPPAYTMAFRKPVKYGGPVPGPGAYAPEKCPSYNHFQKAAAYTMRFRHTKVEQKPGPGPIYMLPTCIGPEIPDIQAEAAYSMAFKRKYRKDNIGPGPAAYDYNINLIKKKCPAYSMKFRHKPLEKKIVPGPQYSYSTDLIKKRQPVYSFGLKHSPCVALGLTEDDE